MNGHGVHVCLSAYPSKRGAAKIAEEVARVETEVRAIGSEAKLHLVTSQELGQINGSGLTSQGKTYFAELLADMHRCFLCPL